MTRWQSGMEMLRTHSPAWFCALYVFAAAAKIVSIEHFDTLVSTFTIFASDTRSAITFLVPMAELTVAMLLLFESSRLVGMVSSLLLLSVFTLVLIVLVSRPASPACDCVGAIVLAKSAAWSNRLSLARNIVLLFVNVLALLPVFHTFHSRRTFLAGL